MVTAIEHRAAHQLLLIERQTTHMRDQEQQVIELLIGASADAGTKHVVVPEDGGASPQPSIAELEHYAPQWSRFVQDDPLLRASLAKLLGQKYRFSERDIPNIRRVLDLDEPRVQQAYQTAYGHPVTAIYAIDSGGAETPEQEPAALGPDLSLPREIADELSWVYLQKGDTLMRESDEADAMYVVMSGRLRATVRAEDGDQRPVGEIGRGETVGEMALVTGERRSTTIRAVRDSELVQLTRTGFERLVEKYPRALLPIVRVMAARVRQGNSTQRSGTSVTTIAVLPIGSEAPLGEFSHLLADALSRHGPTLHLNSTVLRDRHSNAGDFDSTELPAWLNDQESRYRYVLYEADAEATSWTRRCIRQADRILLLAWATPPALGHGIDPGLWDADSAVDRELVLLHPDDTDRPIGTRQWLDGWRVARHHHVRLHRQSDMQRLARSLVGCAVGLVLSGGGARCFAQIGVIRALQEAGVPVDWVAGSSAGAVIAAEFALGWDWDTILSRSKQLLTGRRGVLDYTIPIVSLLAAGRLSRALASLFGESQIEDLWLGFFCTSSNLASARLVIHRTGPVRRAVRASIALPGVIPPLLENGELLVDGGILDNLPVEIMKEFCDGGPVIAVDISAEFQMAKEYRFGEGLSAGQLFLNRTNPFARSKLVVPSIVNILLRTAELQAVRSRKDQRIQADLYIQPPVATFGTFDTGSIDQMVEVGYQYGRDRIAEWRALDESAWAS